MQNTSNAVMASRIEPLDSLDDFPTQPWATRALVEKVLIPFAERKVAAGTGRDLFKSLTAWEPSCNRGHMVKPLREYFGSVITSDIHDYSDEGFTADFIQDFLTSTLARPSAYVDFVITNPPFRLAMEFLFRSQELGVKNFAMIVRTSYLEGGERYRKIFEHNPPTIVAQFVERVPMVKGRLTRKGSTATAYCWLVWLDGEAPIPLQWIPPCRKQLERDGDYDA